MANESTAVYKDYEAALSEQKVQLKSIGADGSATYNDVTGASLASAGYVFEVAVGASAGRVYTSVALAAYAASGDDLESGALGSGSTTTYWTGNKTINGVEYAFDGTSNAGTATDGSVDANGDALTYPNLGTNSTDGSTATVSNLIQAGFIVLVKCPTDPTNGGPLVPTSEGMLMAEYKAECATAIADEPYEVNVATDTNLQEVSDETALMLAEAVYEADMKAIDAKDTKFDTDIAALEAERSAITTEMDTLKSVLGENVDRTFKLFS